jgi:hypothetical protein
MERLSQAAGAYQLRTIESNSQHHELLMMRWGKCRGEDIESSKMPLFRHLCNWS